MFTGIVEGVGTVNKISKITKNRSAIEMTIDLGKQVKGLKIGQSVALNGVCLTATKISKSKCIFEMIEETTKKTDLGNLKVGGVVNIERSLKAGDRLEGHFVLGHVDGVGIIKKIVKKPLLDNELLQLNSILFLPKKYILDQNIKKIKSTGQLPKKMDMSLVKFKNFVK